MERNRQDEKGKEAEMQREVKVGDFIVKTK
jgi:hypothetical protein